MNPYKNSCAFPISIKDPKSKIPDQERLQRTIYDCVNDIAKKYHDGVHGKSRKPIKIKEVAATYTDLAVRRPRFEFSIILLTIDKKKRTVNIIERTIRKKVRSSLTDKYKGCKVSYGSVVCSNINSHDKIVR